MNSLSDEQKADCQERIDKANAEMKAICEKYQIEPVITADFMLGDTKFKSVLSPIQNENI